MKRLKRKRDQPRPNPPHKQNQQWLPFSALSPLSGGMLLAKHQFLHDSTNIIQILYTCTIFQGHLFRIHLSLLHEKHPYSSHCTRPQCLRMSYCRCTLLPATLHDTTSKWKICREIEAGAEQNGPHSHPLRFQRQTPEISYDIPFHTCWWLEYTCMGFEQQRCPLASSRDLGGDITRDLKVFIMEMS